MTERYRFGGPIPESVKRMKARREWRASRLFATVKRGRARDRAAAVEAAAPYSHLEAGPLTAEQINRFRASFSTALKGRPGTNQGPWITHPVSAPKPGCLAALCSRFRSVARAVASRVRATFLAKPE